MGDSSQVGLVIEAESLVKVYRQGGVRAVDGLNLRVRRGEIYAFIGANGSGKTTAINMMTGALAPTSGIIRVLGVEQPRNRHEVASLIGVAPQEYSLYQDLTVDENLEFFAGLNGVEQGLLGERAGELLDILNLRGRRRTPVSELSGGMKRRVSIACALIHDPEIVFFDEATVGVDPVLRQFFWGYFRSLAERGVTIVVTSHVMDEAERADRIGLMRAGRLIEEGTPSELKQRHGVNTVEEVFLKLSGGVTVDG
ncbi:TPA: ABC transporter ATP-binding protein [Candidatus Bathyarchaeota archaeon]|nr:ABC transporter ATP-binding protein [Candidatus Bathyarchaeota archaeon]